MLNYYILLIVAIIPLFFFPNNRGLIFSLLFVSSICSIRYGQGDYFGYLSYFESAENFTFAQYFHTISSWKEFAIQRHSVLQCEFGYFILQKIFNPLGFETFIFFTTFFFFTACYFFIKEFVAPQYYWLAVVVLYNPIITICFLSAIRQSIACAFFIFALVALARRSKSSLIVLFILLGMQFHISCGVCFILLFLRKIKFNQIAIPVIVICLLSPLFRPIIYYLARLTSYAHYMENTSHTSSLLYSFALCSLLTAGMVAIKIDNYKTNLIAILTLGLVAARILPALMPELYFVNRIGMYFEFVTVAFFPLVLQYNKNGIGKFVIAATLFFLAVRTYFFFDNPAWIGNSKFYYSTIFNKEAWENDN